jgi:putative endonuclease
MVQRRDRKRGVLLFWPPRACTILDLNGFVTNLLRQSGIAKMKWIVYILECSDNSLYTGITNDLERRLEEHRTGRGAKYTKHRSPLRVRYTEYHSTKSAALVREGAIKSLARSEKLALIAAQPIPGHSTSVAHLSAATNESG